VSITNRLKSYRSSAAKTVGAAAALAVFAGLLTPTSVSATTQNAVDVQMYVVDNDTVQVCINFDDGYGIPSYVFTDNGDHFGDPTDVREYNDESNDYQYINNSGLSIDWDHTGEINEDFEMSFIGFDESVETDADYVDCELVFEVDNLDPFVMWDEGNQLNFEYSVWLEEEYTDGVNTGTSAYRTDFDDSWAVHNPDTVRSNYIDTAVGLANSNDAVTDERHTAFFCINDYWATDDWDGIDQDWWGYSDINELPTIRVWDDTEGAYVDSEDGITINNYWSDYEGEGNFPSNNSWEDDCNDGYETGSLIGGLTLGPGTQSWAGFTTTVATRTTTNFSGSTLNRMNSLRLTFAKTSQQFTNRITTKVAMVRIATIVVQRRSIQTPTTVVIHRS
jgi:hypothetical protein